MQNELNGEKHIVDAFQSDKRGTRWPFILIVLGVALCILAVVFDFFDVERKYTDVFFALLLIGLAVLVVSAIAILIVNGKSMSIKGKVITIVFLLVVSAPLVYLGVRPFQEEKVYDAFYNAEEIVVREFGADSYEILHNSDLPFYKGDNTDHVVVYVNGEDGSKPFDRLWIIVSPETESEAIAVLEDFEAFLDNKAPWIRDDEAIHGTTEVVEAFGPGISHHPSAFWDRDIPDAETWENAVVKEKGYTFWYARRHKTMVLVMNITYSSYERDGEVWSEPNEMNDWKKRVEGFNEYFENDVDTDGFWE